MKIFLAQVRINTAIAIIRSVDGGISKTVRPSVTRDWCDRIVDVSIGTGNRNGKVVVGVSIVVSIADCNWPSPENALDISS